MNKKGFIEIGAFALSGIASGFICVAVLLIGISQLPAVKDDFRAKKAVILCEEGYRDVEVTDCSVMVEGMSKEAILAYIKDDIEVPQYVMSERLGG